jgi:hypothetical protein
VAAIIVIYWFRSPSIPNPNPNSNPNPNYNSNLRIIGQQTMDTQTVAASTSSVFNSMTDPSLWIRASDLRGLVAHRGNVMIWPQANRGHLSGTSIVLGTGAPPIFTDNGAFPFVKFNDPDPGSTTNGAFMDFGPMTLNHKSTGYTHFVCFRNHASAQLCRIFELTSSTPGQTIGIAHSGNTVP